MNWIAFTNRPFIHTLELFAWACICGVGLIFAASRIRTHPVVARMVIAALTVLLIPCLRHGLFEFFDLLAGQNLMWAVPARDWLGDIPFVLHISQTLGFALLTVAIFAGRKPIGRRDPDEVS